MINFNIDLKENGGRGVGFWEPPFLPLQKKTQKTTFNDLISSDSRILFPNTVLSEEVMSPRPPPKKKIHFSIPQVFFCHRILYLCDCFPFLWCQPGCRANVERRGFVFCFVFSFFLPPTPTANSDLETLMESCCYRLNSGRCEHWHSDCISLEFRIVVFRVHNN